MQLWRSVRESLEFLLGMIWDGYGSEVEVEGIWGPSVIAFHSACTDNIKFQSNSRTSRFWHHVIFKNLAFVLIWCNASPERLDGNNLFRPSTLRSMHWNSQFFSRHQTWIALNAFHGGQALATALKCNKSVVDINLAVNYCYDEGAEVRWTWVQGE